MKAGRAYWKDVVVSEAENIAYTLTTTKDPYRDGVHPTSGGADQIGLAESWAEFMGAVISTFIMVQVKSLHILEDLISKISRHNLHQV